MLNFFDCPKSIKLFLFSANHMVLDIFTILAQVCFFGNFPKSILFQSISAAVMVCNKVASGVKKPYIHLSCAVAFIKLKAVP